MDPGGIEPPSNTTLLQRSETQLPPCLTRPLCTDKTNLFYAIFLYQILISELKFSEYSEISLSGPLPASKVSGLPGKLPSISEIVFVFEFP